MDYGQYLLTEHWKTLRKRKMSAAGWKCERCQSKTSLQVHHLRYRNWFDVGLEDLRCLCRVCHERAHGIGPDDPLYPRLGPVKYELYRQWLAVSPKGGTKSKRNFALKRANRGVAP